MDLQSPSKQKKSKVATFIIFISIFYDKIICMYFIILSVVLLMLRLLEYKQVNAIKTTFDKNEHQQYNKKYNVN